MTIRYLLTAGAVALGIACGPSTALAQSDVPIISREVLFGNPNKASPRISPDGHKLSFLAPVGGALNVWVGPIDRPAMAKPVTNDTGRGIRSYFWAHTNQHILYLQDVSGDDHWRLYSVDLRTGHQMPLTPDSATAPDETKPHKVTARVQHISYKFPHEVLVGLNDRDPRLHDLYRVNIDTGELVGVQFNEGFLRFYTDDDFQVRLAARVRRDGGNDLMVPSTDGGWEVFDTISMEDLRTTGPVDFDKTGEWVYFVDSRGRNTASLKSINVKTRAARTLAKDRHADISGGILIHPTEKYVQAASSTYARKEWHIIDKRVKKDFSFLTSLVDGELAVISRSLNDDRWIVGYEMDNGPVRYYRFDRLEQQAHFLFTGRSQLDGLPLARMHSQVIKSRDRLKLVSYYTLPVWSDAHYSGRPREPLPMVLWVHGGPWARDTWGFDPVHQWLANRGYAVLSVNFRGSTGFGKKFINAANNQWSGKMHDDLIDAVDWAVKKKIADPERVAIMGGSYGGYAALVGMTFTPKKFACGVDIVGPSNLITFLEAIPPHRQPLKNLWATRVGNHSTGDGRLALLKRSPLTFVDRIERPLLIGHGRNDPRVKESESRQIAEAMQARNIPVTFVIYPDEGHGFARHENRLSFFAVTEAFLAEHLGGRYEPLLDFAGSTITIPIGADQIAAVFGGGPD